MSTVRTLCLGSNYLHLLPNLSSELTPTWKFHLDVLSSEKHLEFNVFKTILLVLLSKTCSLAYSPFVTGNFFPVTQVQTFEVIFAASLSHTPYQLSSDGWSLPDVETLTTCHHVHWCHRAQAPLFLAWIYLSKPPDWSPCFPLALLTTWRLISQVRS